MTKRKKKVLIIQLFLFLTAIFFFFSTYNNKNPNIKGVNNLEKKITANKPEKDDSNRFEDISYKGIDLRGNRYIVESKIAEFNSNLPELINMKVMKATFYFKDGTILTVVGNSGAYNNKTNDMNFKENVITSYEDSFIYSDNLDYFNTKNLLTIYGNVRSESIQGNIKADKASIDLSSKTINLSMFNESQVNIKLRN